MKRLECTCGNCAFFDPDDKEAKIGFCVQAKSPYSSVTYEDNCRFWESSRLWTTPERPPASIDQGSTSA